MSIKTESLIEEHLGDKLYCSRTQLVNICIMLGLCGSTTGAISAVKDLPWTRISSKRCVVLREIAIKYLENNLTKHSHKRNV